MTKFIGGFFLVGLYILTFIKIVFWGVLIFCPGILRDVIYNAWLFSFWMGLDFF